MWKIKSFIVNFHSPERIENESDTRNVSKNKIPYSFLRRVRAYKRKQKELYFIVQRSEIGNNRLMR